MSSNVYTAAQWQKAAEILTEVNNNTQINQLPEQKGMVPRFAVQNHISMPRLMKLMEEWNEIPPPPHKQKKE